MDGAPWTKAKMAKALERTDRDQTLRFDFKRDKPERLAQLDETVFQARPDLVLGVASENHPNRYTDEELQRIAELRHVKKLDLHGNARRELAAVSAMRQLTSLRVSTVTKLDLSFLAGLKKLRAIELHGPFVGLELVGELQQLRRLRIGTGFESLECLRGLDKLTDVTIHSPAPIDDFTPLNQPALRVLHLCDIGNLTDVSTLAGFGGLRSLKLSAPKAERLPAMEGLASLRLLELDNMKSWTNPDALAGLPALRELRLSDINKKLTAEDFGFLTQMPALAKADFLFMGGQKRVLALRDRFVERGKKRLLPKGEAAELLFQDGPGYDRHKKDAKKSSVTKNKCGVFIKARLNAEGRQRLARYRDAKTLTIEGLKAESLDFLADWKQLEDVKMYSCRFGDCSTLAALKNLKHVFINGVRSKEADLSYLSHLHRLETLGICWAAHLTQLPDLSRCKRLRWLCLTGLKRLEDLAAVLRIPNLQSLSISQTPLTPDDLVEVMRKPGMRAMSGGFGTKKANQCFSELLKQHNLAYGAGPK